MRLCFEPEYHRIRTVIATQNATRVALFTGALDSEPEETKAREVMERMG